MRRLTRILAALFLCAPLMASAHATPVSYEPGSSVSVKTAPKDTSVEFSERIDAAASSLKVENASGEGVVSVGNARVDPSDPRKLSVSLRELEKGTYKATWSVVSADDGHFTRGSYFFAVGEALSASSTPGDFELVTKSLAPEALGMSVELMGNGFLWAALLFFAFAARPLIGRFSSERPLIERVLTGVVVTALCAIVLGSLSQLMVKAADLTSLQQAGFLRGLALYAQTGAGEATLARMIAGACAGMIFLAFRKRIFASRSATYYEWAMAAALAAFAFFRAVISHATANPFHPHVSILVNFFHVIEKDFWAGMAGILLLFALMPRLRAFLKEALPRASVMMALSAALVGVTASYIVWLHLKSADNLFTTAWGEAFLQLLAAAALIVGVRTYHTASRLWHPRAFASYLPLTLALEFACGVMVVYFSSVVILTSPPLPQPPTHSFSATSEGMTIRLAQSPTEDGALLLEAGGTSPTATLGGASLALERRFDGGYIIPKAVLEEEPQMLEVTAPQEDRYDAHASFLVSAKDFSSPQGWEASRPFDGFTMAMLCIGCAALLYALLLAWLSLRTAPVEPLPHRAGARALVGAALAAALMALLAWGLPASGVLNPFKAECEGDGNMWHLMLPTKAGVPASTRPQEGCMWGMGAFQYQFPDRREYQALKSLGTAKAVLATSPRVLAAGVPAELTVSLANPDGTPATLFVDMEKLVHMVVVSEDETTFAHIHAQETPQERAASTYRFSYTFPKAGKYLVSADYAHGLTLESAQFIVEVGGAPPQRANVAQYPSEGDFQGYHVALKYALPIAGEPMTMQYTITKDGAPVTDLEQYLSAAMHVSVVKNDLSAFVHVHGEVHPPGTPLPPIIVKNGQVVHTMASMIVPARFGPTVDAHLIFPTPGLYTVWGEFTHQGNVIPTAFTVRVEE